MLSGLSSTFLAVSSSRPFPRQVYFIKFRIFYQKKLSALTVGGILDESMREEVRTILLAASITLSILVVNLAVGATSVKASQKIKSFNGISTNSAMFEEQKEIVQKVKEYLPKKNVNYRKVIAQY